MNISKKYIFAFFLLANILWMYVFRVCTNIDIDHALGVVFGFEQPIIYFLAIYQLIRPFFPSVVTILILLPAIKAEKYKSGSFKIICIAYLFSLLILLIAIEVRILHLWGQTANH